MSKGKGKGSAFERELCRTLSLWWSDGERDDLLWRSSNSGGRATVRGRRGKKTTGHCGDIAATDPSIQELTSLITFEAKRGYNSCSIMDILDKPKNGAQQQWEKWFDQVKAAAGRAGTPFWMLVVKRDHREPLAFMPYSFKMALQKVGAESGAMIPIMECRFSIGPAVVGMTLANFLTIHHDYIKELWRLHQRKELS